MIPDVANIQSVVNLLWGGEELSSSYGEHSLNITYRNYVLRRVLKPF